MLAKDNIIISYWRSLMLSLAGLVLLFGATSSVFALGLGELRVRSSLGQSLLVHTNVVGDGTETLNPSCLRARVVSMDGAFIASANIAIHQRQKQRALSFSTQQAINEPAINLIIDINCQTQLHREFSILLDPPDVSANAAGMRDNSPFAKEEVSPAQVAKPAGVNEPSSAHVKATERKKRIAKPELAGDGSESRLANFNDVPSEKKRSGKKSESKDVLKLSDEVIIPNLSSGLRMSDVLSSEAGQQLVQNTEELRAAQARMAAILRDEPFPTAASAVPPGDNGAEIAKLKLEAEKLRQQNLLDKSALTQLQSKSGFDYWVIALAIIAILAIVVILFLLLYIRKNLSSQSATWWEGEDQFQESQPEKIEDVISHLQASYEVNPVGAVLNSDSGHKQGSESKPASSLLETADADPDQRITENSNFQRTPSLEETNSSIFNFFAPRGNSVKVEEISDVTQEAEFWISMNDPQRAIEILAAQEEIEHPESPLPWLFLLDLYRTVNDQQKYDRLRDRFIAFFNANIPEFGADLSAIPSRQLEDFPHLMQKICDAWNKTGIIPYLESLLVDDREGKRAGFDLPVYRDILMLLGIAHELERITAIEGPIKDTRLDVDVKLPLEENLPDPIAETDFGTIEFEVIDFPKKEVAKK